MAAGNELEKGGRKTAGHVKHLARKRDEWWLRQAQASFAMPADQRPNWTEAGSAVCWRSGITVQSSQ